MAISICSRLTSEFLMQGEEVFRAYPQPYINPMIPHRVAERNISTTEPLRELMMGARSPLHHLHGYRQ